MLALPIRLRGLGIFDPRKSSEDSYRFSVSVTFPLAAAIILHLIVQFSIVNVISSKRHFPSNIKDLLTAFPLVLYPAS